MDQAPKPPDVPGLGLAALRYRYRESLYQWTNRWHPE